MGPSQSLFATTPLVPVFQNSSIAGTSLVVGLKFFTTAPGEITSIRYYRDANEPCVGHTGTVFNSLGKVETRGFEFDVSCSSPRVSEWVTISLPGSATTLIPGQIYTLTVGAFTKYPYTPNAFNVTGYRNRDLSVIPDATLTGKPSPTPGNAAPPRGTRFKSTNFFIDLEFRRTNEPDPFKCNANFPAPVVAGSGAQTLFNSTENVAALSLPTKVNAPVAIGVRYKVQKAGYILAIRWFRDPLEPENPHFGIIYDVVTKTSRSVSLIGPDCTRGWVQQSLKTPLRVEAGQEFIAAVSSVTRFPLTSNYFGKTPKVSGDLIATGGVRGKASTTAMPTQSIPRGGNAWVDVLFSDKNFDCSTSPDGAPCDNGNKCSFGDECSAGVCTTLSLNECQVSSDADPCTYNECEPTTGECSIVKTREVGYTCNDFDLCTSNDACNIAGQCRGATDAVACPACGPVVTTTIDQGFETTTSSGGNGWSFTPASGVSFTTNNARGGKCLEFNRFYSVTATSDAYFVTSGTQYLASVWVRGLSNLASIAVLDASNNVIAEAAPVQLGERTEDWRQVPIIFTPTVSSVKIRMSSSEWDAVQVWFDDVSICEVA